MTVPAFATEADLQARWCAGLRGPRRTEDGRSFRVVFPGVPGPGHGPDIRDAVIDLDGDELRGDVEFHLRATGWRAHGHAGDDAYRRVILHVVAANDGASPVTVHDGGRVIPLAVVGGAGQPSLPAFRPPCAGRDGDGVSAVLSVLGRQRFRRKAANARLGLHRWGEGGLLYALFLETLGGPVNREPFRAIAERLPLAALLDRASAGPGSDRAGRLRDWLGRAAGDLPLSRTGLRPAAFPERRLDAAAHLVDALWPAADPGWPSALSRPDRLVPALRVLGIGASMATELAVNAVLPVAVAAGRWPEHEATDALARLRAPSPYGRLRRLASWLAPDGPAPFTSAAELQGGLLLHAEWCARGRCGRCPLTAEGP